ncbi:phosphonate C-P lyase system protein PhnH [Roseiterribacter gracilis]|uniref:Carbon-phosphorus lyase subunit PhnH n=1 Tax=Roseiterribacter gracilis TaxID=2812848 RepID=A0A8S8X708_9PROT|nr:carbon-phosphorus lyase subunit PhnH [Rhodospirillales bacterium TMPK1]
MLEGSGFEDPVHDAQRSFRALLNVLSEPGTIATLPQIDAPSLPAAAAAIALTLTDRDAPAWLDPSFAAAAQWLRFFAGAPIVTDLREASFVFAPAASRPQLAALAQGDPAYPDRSATLVLTVAALSNDPGWRLSGPGINGTRDLSVKGIDLDFLADWHDNRARFPRGVDVLLVAGDRVAGLPRTVQIEPVHIGESACMSR